MNSVITKQRHIFTIAILFVLAAGCLLGGYLFGSSSSNGEQVKQFVLTQDVGKGQSLKDKYKIVSRPAEDSINSANLITDPKMLDEAIALVDLYRNESINKSSIGDKEDLPRNVEFALPTTVEGALASTLQVDDVVSIKVKFEDKRDDACIVSSVRVKDIRTSNGEPITDNSTTPGFLIFFLTADEVTDVNAASKEGTVYVTRPRDLSEPMEEPNYNVVKNKSVEESKFNSYSSTNSAN